MTATTVDRHPLRWIALSAIVLTSFIGTWDIAAPTVALPAITREFDVGIDTAVWVLAVDSLFFAVPMVIFGKLGDTFGHRRTYLIATGGFAIAALSSGFAANFGWLLVSRALQGITSSPAYVATMVLIATMFPIDERGRAMGIMGMAASVAWAIGPVIGGVLMHWFSWRSIILVEVPVVMGALALAWWLMPEDSRQRHVEFDLVGAASLAGAVLSLMLSLRMVGVSGVTGMPTILLGSLSLGLLGVFVAAEARAEHPFVPLKLFANFRFSAAIVFSVAQMIVLFGVTLLTVVFLQEAKGYDPARAGLLVAGLSGARVFASPLAGRIVEVYGSRLPSLIGTYLIGGVTLIIALFLTKSIADSTIVTAMVALGIGVSLCRTPVNTAITHLVEAKTLGLALGVFSMFTFTGGSVGQAFFGALLRNLSGVGNAPLASAPELVLRTAFSTSFAVITGVALLASLFALHLPGKEIVSSPIPYH